MSNYITKDDYLSQIREKRLLQIINNDESFLDKSEGEAIAIIKDKLFEKYEIDEIFNKVGDDRHLQVVRYCVNVALYILYERVADAVTPNRIIKNYDDTMLYLDDVNKGVVSMNLPRKVNAENEVISTLRIGSRPPRSH